MNRGPRTRSPTAKSVVAGAALTFWAWTGIAEAQAADADAAAAARAQFQRGVEALGASNYADALVAFQRAYSLDPQPGTLFNIAMCQRALFDLTASADNLRRYLAEVGGGGPPELRAEAQRVLGEIDLLLASLTVEVQPPGAAVYVDGVLAGRAPLGRAVRVPPGEHVVLVNLEGYEDASRRVTVGSGESLTVSVSLVRTDEPVVGGLDGPGGSPPQDGGRPVADEESLNPWFWVALGITGAAGATAIATGSTALVWKSDFEDGGSRDAELRDSARALGLATDVLLGVAAAGAVAALVAFLVTDSSDDAAPAGETPAATAWFHPLGLVVRW